MEGLEPMKEAFDMSFDMSFPEWEDENWHMLKDSILRKNFILMLGPDAATEVVEGKQRPLTEILANQLAKEFGPEYRNNINTSDLAQVTQYYYMEKGRFSLEAQVVNFYKNMVRPYNNLHKILADIPFNFVVTTSHDNMLITALKEKGKEPVVGWYNFKRSSLEIQEMGSENKPLIYYLYGTLNEPESLVLTQNDLLDFLVDLKHYMPSNVMAELQSEEKCFLFIGVGFRQWYLRILLHVLLGREKGRSPSFALEQFTQVHEKQLRELREIMFFFRKCDYKIHIFNQDFKEFASQLRRKLWKRPLDRTPLVKTPEVFICHASEDKEDAAFLSEKLKEAGIRPWLDKEKLRGGDNWDNSIKRTIKKIDYFVVLQSEALENKKIGYVNREIYEALDRQKDFRNHRFVIPVKIEECKPLENLKHLQTINLTDKSKIKDLINTINCDFTRRGY